MRALGQQMVRKAQASKRRLPRQRSFSEPKSMSAMKPMRKLSMPKTTWFAGLSSKRKTGRFFRLKRVSM